MASKFDILKKVLTGGSAQYKIPTERPSMKTQRQVFDSFQRAAQSIYQQTLQGSVERLERYKDYEEMDHYPEITRALDIYADDSMVYGAEGNVLKIVSDDEKLQNELEELFYERLDIEFHLWTWIRNMCKYGDHFNLLDLVEGEGVLGAIALPVYEVNREEGFNNDPNSLRFKWLAQGNTSFENYQISHMRILGDDRFLPYGRSALDSSRKVYKQLLMAEDAMLIYRITRAPERRVFYIDVGNIPPKDVDTYLQQTRDKLRRTPMVSESSGNRDLRFNPEPIAGYTNIPLLDGRTITIKEIAEEYEQGKVNWTYSIQDKTHNIVPGKITWCGKNYTSETIVRVHLDNGSCVDTAPTHPFILRDGKELRADELEIGQSLMPLYRDTVKRGKYDYQSVYNPSTEKYEATHTLVAKDVHYENMLEKQQLINEDDNNNKNIVVHHKDFNRYNNTPDNLEWMGNVEHFKYHSDVASIRFKEFWNKPENIQLKKNIANNMWSNPEFRKINSKRAADNLRNYAKSEKHSKVVIKTNKEQRKAQHMGSLYNGTDLHKSHNVIRSKVKSEKWAQNRELYCEAMKWIIPNKAYSIAKEIIRDNPTLSRDKLFSILKENEVFRNIISYNNTRDFDKFNSRTFFDKNGVPFSELKKEAISFNHKIVNIEIINNANTDVYCMTVEGCNGEQDRHNFATEDIFVKNSILEDFFVPIRQDRGSRIETLPGGENAAAIEDIQYLQNKLFISLGVPKSYLTAEEDLSGKGTLAQEDIKFARTIQRIQKIVISELAKIGLIHLYLKGYDEQAIYNFNIQLTNPSTVTEMMHLDLVDKRFSTAAQMADSPLMSRLYIQKEVLKLTDSEIIDIKENSIKEAEEFRIIEKIKEGEDPMAGMGGFGGGGEEGGFDGGEEDGGEEEGEEEPAEEGKGYSSMKDVTPYDPIGTDELDNYPKFDSFENNFESSVDSIVDGSNKSSLDLRKRKSGKKDPFSKKITEIMKFDTNVRTIMSNLKTEKSKELISETGKVFFAHKD